MSSRAMSTETTLALVGVGVSGAIVATLLYFGHKRDTEKRQRMAQDDPLIVPIGMFPALRVGDVVLVDSAAANLPAPFNALPTVPAAVDMILLDPLLVSIQTPMPRIPGAPHFGGTIPRSSIKSVVPIPGTVIS